MRPIPSLDEAEILVMKAVQDWTPVTVSQRAFDGLDADGLSLAKFIARRLFVRVAESVPHIHWSTGARHECEVSGGCAWWREINRPPEP